MADRLLVDTDALTSLGSSLSGLADTLAQASASAAGLGEAVGDARLAEQVHRFASSWDDRRAALVGRLRTLGDGCGRVATTFDETDASLAAAARGEGAR